MPTTATYEIPELPTLEPGVTLLDTGDADPRVPLQSLAIDRTLLDGGTAIWVGTGRYCTTSSLADLAPSRRILDRVKVARGFTPYQHTVLIRQLAGEVSDDTAVVVVPDIDAHYRDDVQGDDGQAMLLRALASLARVAREFEVPVLCTRNRDDAFAAPVEAAATETIEFRETPLGPRFIGAEFETLVYPLGDGWVQTTLAFWQDILKARQPLHTVTGVTQEVTIGGAH